MLNAAGFTVAVAMLMPLTRKECEFGASVVSVQRVVDGDTLVVDILLPWDITLRGQSVRLVGFDAPEISRRRSSVIVTDEEIERGLEARDYLRGLLSRSERILLVPARRTRDNYGRILGRLQIEREGVILDVAAIMILRGHVRH